MHDTCMLVRRAVLFCLYQPDAAPMVLGLLRRLAETSRPESNLPIISNLKVCMCPLPIGAPQRVQLLLMGAGNIFCILHSTTWSCRRDGPCKLVQGIVSLA